MSVEMDHIVLNAIDEDRVLAFYADVLGFRPQRLEEYRAGTAPFPSVRINERTIIDLFPKTLWQHEDTTGARRTNLNHFCVTIGKEEFRALSDRLAANGTSIDVGPVPRWGARGMGTSIYFKDPEGNVVEARYYETPDVREELRDIESFEVDVQGRLRTHTLLGHLLNAAWNHARGSSIGSEELAARNLMWVLLKVQIVIRRYPRQGERISLTTWGKRVERLSALRDFTLTDARGEKMISATSAWAVLDRSTGRPQRIDRIDGGFPWQPDRNEMDTDLKKVPELPAGLPLARFRVLSSDIDTNGHVNSTSYLRWIVDSQPRAKLEASELEGIELSFLDEALPSDEVEVVSDQGTGAEPGAGIELCCIRRTGDQMELFRARLKWRMVGEAEPHR